MSAFADHLPDNPLCPNCLSTVAKTIAALASLPEVTQAFVPFKM